MDAALAVTHSTNGAPSQERTPWISPPGTPSRAILDRIGPFTSPICSVSFLHRIRPQYAPIFSWEQLFCFLAKNVGPSSFPFFAQNGQLSLNWARNPMGLLAFFRKFVGIVRLLQSTKELTDELNGRQGASRATQLEGAAHCTCGCQPQGTTTVRRQI